MSLAIEESNSQVQVWASLAELFVGKQLQDYDYRAIAAVLKESGLPTDELTRILCDEVAPVFRRNLSYHNPVPQMETWSFELVGDRVRSYLQHRHRSLIGWLLSRFQSNPLDNTILCNRWNAVLAILSE